MSLARIMQRPAKVGLLRARWLCLLWHAALLFVLGTASTRGATTASETELKAAFLYNFAKFVEWPADSFLSETAPLRVVVFGDDDTVAKLKSLLSDKKAHGRSFEVRRVTSPQEARNAQIVFVTSAESKRTLLILDAVKRLPVLTIGDADDFLDSGGMINFYFEEAQLRFDINAEVAEKVKLVISSKLLRLAKKRSFK